MFKEAESGIVESSEGFTVNDHDHFELRYVQGDHIARFYTESGGRVYIYYLRGPVTWQPPFDHEIIPPDHQELIKDRIVAAIHFRGYPVEIVR